MADMATLEVLRGMLKRASNSYEQHTCLPDESDVGLSHRVDENTSGDLRYMSSRVLKYAGGGRWQAHPGSYALWYELGGTVRSWRDLPESLIKRAEALLDRAIAAAAKDQPDGK